VNVSDPIATLEQASPGGTSPDGAGAASPAQRSVASRHLSPVLGRYHERAWSHGEGHRLFDTSGRDYLDFANGIAVTGLGHRHPAVTAAIHAQVDRVIGPLNAIGYAEPISALADAIAEAMPAPLDTVMFLNSGSEAIEAALKLARRASGRPAIVAFRGGFHGRTFGAASITSSSLNYRSGYEPLLPGVYLTGYPSAYRDYGSDDGAASAGAMRDLRELCATTVPATSVAAIIIEPVLGEGGYIPAPPAFLRELRDFCDEHGILLVADEVQTGFGRTGRMWAFEHAGIVPDVVCLAKAIANGLPLSVIVARPELHERWGKGAHGSTFGGNPVACAAGLAVLRTISEQDLVANAAARGARLSAGLRDLMARDGRIGDIRGPGLMIGMELVRAQATREPDGELGAAFIERAADEGLLVLTCGPEHNVIRFIPPLDVTDGEVDEALDIVGRTLEGLAAA
jgi:4-aminobutyrate aminotransferase